MLRVFAHLCQDYFMLDHYVTNLLLEVCVHVKVAVAQVMYTLSMNTNF